MSNDKPSDKEFKKLDTFARTVYMVKLAQDPKAYNREDGGVDVVLTFCDSSRFEKLEDMWVDARVIRGQSERARKLRKGDIVQIEGKLRFKIQNDGRWRGKVYDAVISTFTPTADRSEVESQAPNFE